MSPKAFQVKCLQNPLFFVCFNKNNNNNKKRRLHNNYLEFKSRKFCKKKNQMSSFFLKSISMKVKEREREKFYSAGFSSFSFSSSSSGAAGGAGGAGRPIS